MKLIITLASLAVAFSTAITLAEPPTTAPATAMPAVALAAATTMPATMPAAASARTAASVINDMDKAYGSLHSLHCEGKITGDFDINGEKHHQETTFASRFTAPNLFTHKTPDDVQLGSTGKIIFSYVKSRDQYQSNDAPKERVNSDQLPAAVTAELAQQNPSLLLAICKSAAAELDDMSKKVSLQEDTRISDINALTLRFELPDAEIMTLLVDPQTHLLRQVRFDYSGPMKKSGAAAVKTALVTVDYTTIDTAPQLPATEFAWAAPTGAQAVTTAVSTEMADDASDFKDLIGKPAPDFKLKEIDDSTVKLSDLKGSVVVIDFWATWCGPCVASLPHLDQLYKDKSDAGLKVLAVNLQEDNSAVKPFVENKKWTFPVALDSDGAVAEKYKASAIPETVIVGKDGTVKQVFVGSGHEDDIKTAVEKEMK